MCIDRAMGFRAVGPVFCVAALALPNADFPQNLGIAMGRVKLLVKRSFTPHMTVLYDRHLVAEHAIEPITSTAKEFVLVNSQVGKRLHEVLGRWSLRA